MPTKEEYKQRLWEQVRFHLKSLNPRVYPGIAQKIETDAGFEHAEDQIFNIAAREGINVPQAMAKLDTEL